MAEASGRASREHDVALRHRYLVQFEEDTLRERPLWIRVIIEFIGTFVLVMVAAGAGVINHYAGDTPVTRAAAVIAPGAAVMAMIYAWGPLSGLHINPAVTLAFTTRRVFPAGWVVPYWAAQFAGAIAAAWFLQAVFGMSARAGTTRSPSQAATGGRCGPSRKQQKAQTCRRSLIRSVRSGQRWRPRCQALRSSRTCA